MTSNEELRDEERFHERARRTDESNSRFGRRRLLRRLGATFGGVMAAKIALAPDAEAADGQTMQVGVDHSGSTRTGLTVGTALITDTTLYAFAAQGNTTSVPNGIFGVGSNVGVGASASRLALNLGSPVSHIRMLPQVPANTASANLLRGEMRTDVNGDVWYQHTDGVGNALKISGPASAGAVHLVDPWRGFDSRSSIGGRVLGAGSSSTFSVVSPTTYNSIASPVPAGAKGVVGTISVAETQGTVGYLTVVAGDVVSTGSTSILWFGPNQLLSTQFTARLSPAGTLKVFNNGPQAGAFIIDIAGYFR